MEEKEVPSKNDRRDDQEVDADEPEEPASAEDDGGSDERPGPRVRVHGARNLSSEGHSPNLPYSKGIGEDW